MICRVPCAATMIKLGWLRTSPASKPGKGRGGRVHPWPNDLADQGHPVLSGCTSPEAYPTPPQLSPQLELGSFFNQNLTNALK